MQIVKTPTNKDILQRIEKEIEKENWVYRDDFYISKRKLLSILKELFKPVVEDTSVEEMAKRPSLWLGWLWGKKKKKF